MGSKVTPEMFSKRVFDLVGDEYTLLSSYKGRHEKVGMRHEKCGYQWMVEAGAFLGNRGQAGSRCPSCAGNITKTASSFKDEVRATSRGEYEMVSDSYINAHTKVTIKHHVCGNEYDVVPMSYTRGNRCPFCDNKRIDNTEVNRRVVAMTDGEFSLSSDYRDAFSHLELKHKVCGHSARTTLAKLDSGFYPRCTYCHPKSRGEAVIAKVLRYDLQEEFEQQKRFKGIKDSPTASYDFFLPSRGILIEYQGEQHYRPVKYFGGEKQFKDQLRRDKAKRNFAEEKGFTLLCIPYTLVTPEDIKAIIYNEIRKSEGPLPK